MGDFKRAFLIGAGAMTGLVIFGAAGISALYLVMIFWQDGLSHFCTRY